MKLLMLPLFLLPIVSYAQQSDNKNPTCNIGGIAAIGQKYYQLEESSSQGEYFAVADSQAEMSAKDRYERDEAVVNIEMKFNMTQPVYYASERMVHKASWFLAPNKTFGSDERYPSLYKWKSRSGEQFDIIGLEDGYFVFVNKEGYLCDKVGRSSPDTTVLIAGTYLSQPLLPMKKNYEDVLIGKAGLRIVYSGSAAGVMSFDEVWVQDGRPVYRLTHSFDQYAKEIEIAGFKIAIKSAKPDHLIASATIPARYPMTTANLIDLSGKIRLAR